MKNVPLEALRGYAALVTVAGHIGAGFWPKDFFVMPGQGDERIQGSLLYLFFNGSSAVSLFFVLSAYVLTRRYCATGDVRILVKAAAKRWPRLAGPVFVAVLASYVLFFFHLYFFEEAGAASGSTWLTKFAGAFHVIGPDATPLSIHFRDALLQGSFLVFFRGDFLFDGTLWTMQPEVVGSFLALGAVPILLEARKSSAWLTVGMTFVAIVPIFFRRPELAAFPVGVCMAVLLPRGAALSPRFAYPLLAFAFYLLGYPAESVGIYAVFKPLVAQGMPYSYPQIVGAVILICVVETFPPIRRLLSGFISRFLGELSFPIYLLHLLVVCSIASKVYLVAGPIPAAVTAFAVSILASLPLMMFNIWWVRRVNFIADMVLKVPQATPGDTIAAPWPSTDPAIH